MILARGESRLVGGKIKRQRGDLVGLADAAHRLTRREGCPCRFIIARGLKPLMQRWRLDGARADRIAANALRHIIGSDGLREPDDGSLCRAIGEAVGNALDRTGDRGHVEDRPASRRQHGRQGGPDQPIHRLHIHVEREVPVLLGAVENRAIGNKAGAVDENIDLTHFRDDLCDRRIIAHVELPRVAFQIIKRPGVEVGCPYGCPFGHEALGNSPTDPLSGSGDKRRFSDKSSIVHLDVLVIGGGRHDRSGDKVCGHCRRGSLQGPAKNSERAICR